MLLTFNECLNDLRSERCRCGEAKSPKQSLCAKCYFLLPNAMRRGLYLRLGKGYEKAYTKALEFLKLPFPERV
jgi:hypothetical protein